ncbi:ribosome small subunit-dependent GTPase A [Thaumasiovibrio subtropicus]|uniref:ribosome small subunit-dependent GTPase A n=1 Tax=Thaumasiovibrio subtropicus TaxID=1891207 RepID=UPI000B35AB19|nr:ribosome small subunit-dependent GTPase A [Thaumasiovibrio subtropicus]
MHSKFGLFSNTQPRFSIASLGWKPFFQQQLTLEEYEQCQIGRVLEHHRDGYVVRTESSEIKLAISKQLPMLTVGDWLLLDHEERFVKVLERSTLFSRKAAGAKVAEQYIAANVDTAFIVSSLNDDFNLSRLERYLAVVREAGAEPVLILTKADLCDDIKSHRQAVTQMDSTLEVEVVNGLNPEETSVLKRWCQGSNTVAFMGSSGVGKSTLVNALLGADQQATGGIREDDAKGRHTTTSRSLHILPEGGILIDTPGMRELQLTECVDGLEATFADIVELAQACRFNDCRHESEPGCKVKQAIEQGTLEARRFANYQKLMREQQRNGASLAEQRERFRQFTKVIKVTQAESRKHKGR